MPARRSYRSAPCGAGHVNALLLACISRACDDYRNLWNGAQEELRILRSLDKSAYENTQRSKWGVSGAAERKRDEALFESKFVLAFVCCRRPAPHAHMRLAACQSRL